MTKLTRKQYVVLAYIAKTGATTAEAGVALGVSQQTVKNHLREAYLRLGVHSLTAAFVKLGWLRPGLESRHT